MKSDADILFALMRAAIEGRRAEGVQAETTQWWSVFRLAQQNRVVVLTAEALTAEVPRDVRLPWLVESARASARQRQRCDVQQHVLQAMNEAGVRVQVLKGTSLAKLYPKAELREFSDIDLYFYDQHAEADAAAQRAFGVSIDGSARHHTRYAIRGVTVESHSTMVDTAYPPSNRRYEAMLEELGEGDMQSVLLQLRHAAGHFAAGRIVARDVVDWALLCSKARGVDWARVWATVEEYGMRPFAEALNKIAHARLGIEIGPEAASAEAVEKDVVYGSAMADGPEDGLRRAWWKVQRWQAHRWKRRMVYAEGDARLLLASVAAHAAKPATIMHKM